MPQLPQLFGSTSVSTHLFEQFVVPPLQESAHLPALQICPLAQALPQLPQFALLTLVSTQVLLQFSVPPRHESEHWPREQTSPTPTEQGLAHAPQ